jgi:hypothetical protein
LLTAGVAIHIGEGFDEVGLEGRGRGDIRKRVGGGTSHTMKDNV